MCLKDHPARIFMFRNKCNKKDEFFFFLSYRQNFDDRNENPVRSIVITNVHERCLQRDSGGVQNSTGRDDKKNENKIKLTNTSAWRRSPGCSSQQARTCRDKLG